MRKGRKPIEECIDCDYEDIQIVELLDVQVDNKTHRMFVRYLCYCPNCDYEFIGIREYDVKYKNFHKERKGSDC